jgi:hypothetical protein
MRVRTKLWSDGRRVRELKHQGFMTARLLYHELRAASPVLADELDAITKEALELWKSPHLRTFTAHGEPHILQVEANLDALTKPLQASPQKLRPEEIFILIAACYLHDIGMQLGERDARERHAQYAFDLILHAHARHMGEERRVTLPINDRNARQAIAAVARGHWTNFAVALDSTDAMKGNTEGRLRLLGLLLAMADLLDLSPERATYFKSIHQLDKLDAMAELHQTMHELVRVFRVAAPNPAIPEELQYQLEWSDDSETTRTISDWALHWFHSQWRVVAPLLHRESNGRIRWAKPWATAKFREPVGPPLNPSDAAQRILRAERANQLRINRDVFTQAFKDAVTKNHAALFRFPSDAEIDGKPVVEWCESHARLQPNIKVARCDVLPTAALEQASIIAQLLEQIGQHLPKCADDEALQRWRGHVAGEAAGLVVVLVVTADYDERLLTPIIEAAVARPASAPARVILLLSLSAAGPASAPGTNVTVCKGEPFVRADVVDYLQKHWGMDAAASEQTCSAMDASGVLSRPARVYDYVRLHCGIATTAIT